MSGRRGERLLLTGGAVNCRESVKPRLVIDPQKVRVSVCAVACDKMFGEGSMNGRRFSEESVRGHE